MITIRSGGEPDFDVLLGLFDEAVEWLVARGSAGQWGTEPWSRDVARREQVLGMTRSGGLYLAELDGEPVGAIVLGDRVAYAPPVDEPEVYIGRLLACRRRPAPRKGTGSALLDFARDWTRGRGIGLLRVDCWSGGDGKLVDYYRDQGFTPTVEVAVKNTTVQIFEQRL